MRSGGALRTNLLSRIMALMCADALALLADSPDDLVVPLGMIDEVASKYGLYINAAKAEVTVHTLGLPLRMMGRWAERWMYKMPCSGRISSASRHMGQPQAAQLGAQ
eukprot:363696-Chlamydomonas_euryale.AAC.5